MKIKYVTLQTWERADEPENKEPSLTRVSDFESIESMFARFMAKGALVELFKPIAQLSPEERDVLDNSVDIDDLLDEDITVQKDFIESVQSSLKTKAVEKKDEPTQTVKQVEPEKNPATEPEDA